MTIADFTVLLETYGANPNRWPDDTKEPVKELILASPDAQKMLGDMARVDALFTANDTSKPPADLLNRILDQIKD